MKALLATILYLWPLIGIWMVTRSGSRGFAADLLFVFTWPLHLIQHLRGRE